MELCALEAAGSYWEWSCLAYLRHRQQLWHPPSSGVPLPHSKTVAILFNEHTGPTSKKKKPKKLLANFGLGLPSYSTDAQNTYKKQEIEKEEEVLGDF